MADDAEAHHEEMGQLEQLDSQQFNSNSNESIDIDHPFYWDTTTDLETDFRPSRDRAFGRVSTALLPRAPSTPTLGYLTSGK